MRGARISQKLVTLDLNVTTEVMDVFESPKARLVQIEILVSLAMFLLIFLVVFGGYRRRCNNRTFRVILWAAYNIPPYLITYTFGLMNAAPAKSDYFPIWATFLMMLLGSADSISAYDFDDTKNWKRYSWQLVIKMMGLTLLVISYIKASLLMIAIVCLYFVALVRVSERAWASQWAIRNYFHESTEWIAKYVRRERERHQSNQDDEVDLTTMKGLDYKVSAEIDWKTSINTCFWRKKAITEAEARDDHVEHPRVITVEMVWQCQGKLLRAGNQVHRIKDLCLSFALSNIFISRFAGYTIPQQVCRKTWKLFQKIVHSGTDDGYERAFRIIEVELAFSFNRLYTKYPLLHALWVLTGVKRMFALIASCAILVACAPTLLPYLKLDFNVMLHAKVNADVTVTLWVINTVLLLEVSAALVFTFSNWGKVHWICSYIQKESWQKSKYVEKLIEIICRIPSLLGPWERKLHQYSLLQSYQYSPSPCVYNFVTSMLIDQVREGQRESASTKLSKEVKSAVIGSIVNNGTKLENGKASLRRYDMPTMLSRACDRETQAQVIMIWHIGTSMCEHVIPAEPDSDFLKDFKIATSLSKYLAYLVAFAPRLLPDHPYVTENVFDQVILEARDAFRTCNSLGDIINELINGRVQGEILDWGARLGNKLIEYEMNPEIIWKVLADFWAELVVYMAPSNDTTAHADHLTMGGEFITHIWALLSHSGIEREPHETPNLERSQSWS